MENGSGRNDLGAAPPVRERARRPSVVRRGLLGLSLVVLSPPLFLVAQLAHEPSAHAGEDATALTIDTLMGRFRAMPGLYAKYREEKTIALLAKPLVSEGTIHYAQPKRLARHTSAPQKGSVVLDDTSLRFGDGSGEEKVDLGASPVVRAFVSGFLQLLAGDRAALEQTFAIKLKPAPEDSWEVVLKPKSAAILGVITELSFAGKGSTVTRMRVTEATGDVAVTTFTEVDPKKKYSAQELQDVFRIPKK